MKDFSKILDNDTLLNELGWGKMFNLTIHYPGQILLGFQKAKKHKLKLPVKPKFYFVNQRNQFNLLANWLKIISQDKIEIITSEDIFLESETMIIKPHYSQKEVLQHLVINIKDEPEILLELKDIPTNDGNSVFLGAICGIMDMLSLIDFEKSINSLVSLMMLKAGALTWRVPAESNFAKIWANYLCEKGLLKISADPEVDFGIVAREWEKLLFEIGGITKGSLELRLSSFQHPGRKNVKGIDTIFGDGKSKIEEAVSLYHLGVITAIYCAIINNIRKEV